MSLTITQTGYRGEILPVDSRGTRPYGGPNYIVNFDQATQLGFLFSHAARPVVLL